MTKERLQEILTDTWKRTDDTDAWDNIIDAMKIAANEAISEAADIVYKIDSMGYGITQIVGEIDELEIND